MSVSFSSFRVPLEEIQHESQANQQRLSSDEPVTARAPAASAALTTHRRYYQIQREHVLEVLANSILEQIVDGFNNPVPVETSHEFCELLKTPAIGNKVFKTPSESFTSEEAQKLQAYGKGTLLLALMGLPYYLREEERTPFHEAVSRIFNYCPNTIEARISLPELTEAEEALVWQQFSRLPKLQALFLDLPFTRWGNLRTDADFARYGDHFIQKITAIVERSPELKEIHLSSACMTYTTWSIEDSIEQVPLNESILIAIRAAFPNITITYAL